MSNKSVGTTDPASRGVSVGFRASIITLFVAVLLVVGLTLVYLSFRRVTAITESAAATFLARVAEHTADRIDAQFKDVHDILEVLRQLPSIQTAEIANNPRLYALMAAMLRNNEHLYNAYVGYDDGSFIQMDVIDRAGPDYRKRLAAPEQTKFRLLTIDPMSSATKARIGNVTFLSDDLVTLSQIEEPTNYDPRERPWYKGAHDPGAGILTDPYIFHATGHPGYTVRAASQRGRSGVVAGDVMLTEAEALLRRQQLGPSGKAFLFDDDDRVIVYPGLGDRVAAQSSFTSGVELPRLAEIDTTGVSGAIDAWRRGGSAGQVFSSVNGRRYAAAFQSIKTAGSANLRLVVMAPLDEFFSEIEQERRKLFLLTLAFVVGMVPFVFWIGSMMSRRLRELAAETDRIQHFAGTDGPQLRSVIREIDNLGRSVHTLRSVVQTFSKFVPRRLVQQLVESRSDMTLGGSRREITVLFTDVANFTAITERADPEQVMIFTSRYFAALSHAIMETGGVVDKFIGDAVMAIWNAPSEDAGHVVKACGAILDCLDANRDLNRAFAQEGWPAYETRFGLHVGEALVGNIGSADRMNFTALGATVNLASRLENLNKNYGTSVLVSEAVRNAAVSGFVFRRVDNIKPKGFTDSFAIFELRCRRGPHTEAEAAFCREWDRLYAAMVNADAPEALAGLDAFLDAYPDDAIATYHAGRLRRSYIGVVALHGAR
ncbi:adenylate cyclase [Tardiphaga sp. OK246]|uniref:adenylate/guanylate cyclase domain-containing protein n=1 Tax=Tardiphaga sp. OK246 TaxID=1855307 RepID=UPI000B6A7934|nr:adenylate/guanylate cyclase domain-containing protein [Tardiphaga sp. OK246]SNT11853.1 adenylate cyclase [Tardiphaga sp. OK246]